MANNISKTDVLVASRGLPASQSLILVTLIAAAVATWYRWAFAILTYRQRRRLRIYTPCEIVPAIPARRFYSAWYSCDTRCGRAACNVSYWSRRCTGMLRRFAAVHRSRVVHAPQSFAENLILTSSFCLRSIARNQLTLVWP